MRKLIRESMVDAKEVLGDVMDEAQGLTNEQIITRYVTEHRGNPRAMIEFAREQVPESVDIFEESVRYENEMERMLESMRGGI